MTYWHHCADCDVKWTGLGANECWNCGKTVDGGTFGAPAINSQYGAPIYAGGT